MKFTKIIALAAIAGLVVVGCKKTETETLTSAEEKTTKEKVVIAPENVQTASFTIDGMTCPEGCAKTIEQELSDLNGVEKAAVDFEKKNSNCYI